MNKTTKIITEDEIIGRLQDFLIECDADTLANLVGEYFGGECHYLNGEGYNTRFVFIPNDNYMGAFDNIGI